jgi:uncharacterized protein YjgD (DUF1641 family)
MNQVLPTAPVDGGASTGANGEAIQALTRKIDALTEQVAYLAEQAHMAERAREERAELMQDAMPAVNDAMRIATEQFQEIEEYVRPEDLLRLIKKIARHGPQIEELVDQLDTVMGLVEVAGPIGKEAFAKAESTLDALERKGYFSFARGGMQIADNVVTSFTEEDVRKLGAYVVLMLNTVKDMTQPEILGLVRTIVAESETEIAKPVNTSLPALIGQMRDPNVRRGLALSMRVMSVIGAQSKNGK